MGKKTNSKYFWDNLKSSNISSIRYDPIGNTDKAIEIGNLTVTFKNGSQYLYENVPLEVTHKIVSSESVGKAFNELIKVDNKYKFSRLK